MSGKGSGRRPAAVSDDAVKENWDRIFVTSGRQQGKGYEADVAARLKYGVEESPCSGQCGFCDGECER